MYGQQSRQSREQHGKELAVGKECAMFKKLKKGQDGPSTFSEDKHSLR